MKVILAVDSIFPPLTGIGRYALELVMGLGNSSRISELRFFRHGQWVEKVNSLLQQSAPVSSIRTTFAGNSFAVWMYSKIVPAISKQRLGACENYLFHSPNFILQPFAGLSIATFHDLSIYRHPGFHPESRVNYMKREIPKTLKMADQFIAVSSFTAQEMQHYLGIPAHKISVVHNGVSPVYHPRTLSELCSPLAKYNLEAGRYLLCVATFEPRKNLSTLIKIYAKLPHSIRNNYPLVLCGCDGWKNDALLELIKMYAGSGWLKVTGYVSETDLPMLFAGAKGFLYPTLYEGFGLPALEAMASGTPVMTSENSAVSEITRDSALLINPHDSTSMGDAIIRLIEDQEWREQAIFKGLCRSAEMSWVACIRNTLDVYSSVIQQN